MFYKDTRDMRGSRGGTEGPDHPPLEKSQNIGFLSNTGPDPLNNHKATKPAFNVGPSLCHWNSVSLAGHWPPLSGFWISSSIKKIKNKPRVGPPLKKLSGSTHEKQLQYIQVIGTI